jgi:hypothetical protein
MAGIMLDEICRKPGWQNRAGGAVAGGGEPGGGGGYSPCPQGVTKDREGYALAAGFALGLVCLGLGRKAAVVDDLQLDQRLR